jgi:hypothetical protein
VLGRVDHESDLGPLGDGLTDRVELVRVDDWVGHEQVREAVRGEERGFVARVAQHAREARPVEDAIEHPPTTDRLRGHPDRRPVRPLANGLDVLVEGIEIEEGQRELVAVERATVVAVTVCHRFASLRLFGIVFGSGSLAPSPTPDLRPSRTVVRSTAGDSGEPGTLRGPGELPGCE